MENNQIETTKPKKKRHNQAILDAMDVMTFAIEPIKDSLRGPMFNISGVVVCDRAAVRIIRFLREHEYHDRFHDVKELEIALENYRSFKELERSEQSEIIKIIENYLMTENCCIKDFEIQEILKAFIAGRTPK